MTETLDWLRAIEIDLARGKPSVIRGLPACASLWGEKEVSVLVRRRYGLIGIAVLESPTEVRGAEPLGIGYTPELEVAVERAVAILADFDHRIAEPEVSFLDNAAGLLSALTLAALGSQPEFMGLTWRVVSGSLYPVIRKGGRRIDCLQLWLDALQGSSGVGAVIYPARNTADPVWLATRLCECWKAA